MKNLLLLASLLIISSTIFGQCAVTTNATSLTCSGVCNGTATAYSSGPTPHTYLWTPSGQTTQTATGLCSGFYTVLVTDGNNCTSTATAYVSSPTPLLFSTTLTPETCFNCCDGTATISPTGGTSPYLYNWSPQPNPGFCSGTYICCITDMNGCISCDTLTIVATSIQENSANNKFQLSPNPSHGSFIIKFENTNNKEIQITNLLGSLICRKNTINQNTITIDDLPTGIYIVSVTEEKGNITFQKMIINSL